MWLTNAKIWDGVSDTYSDCDAIQIEDGKIVRLGASDEASGETRDCQGMALIPGLIDAHVHMCLDPDIKDPLAQDKFSDDEIRNKIAQRAREMLLAGITSARDLGGGNWLELDVRDQINRGELVATRLVCAGQPVTSPEGHCHFWGGEAEDIDTALDVIERQITHKVDLIKIMATGGSLTPGSTPANPQFDENQMVTMVNLAKSRGYTVAAHCHGTSGIKNSAVAGVTTIEHCSWVASLSPVEALRSATSDCADAIGLGAEVGQLSSGFAADIVGYEGDPLLDLEVLAKPVLIMSRGQLVA